MSSPFVAEIKIFGFNFPPTGWASCDGQLLPISQNTALFSLCGTFYGGDGRSTFALPDLQGNAPLHPSDTFFLGQVGGTPYVTLLESEIPVHTHALSAANSDGLDQSPANELYAGGIGGIVPYAVPGALQNLSVQAISVAGGGQPHNNMQPYLTLNFCIALQGVFPPRS